MPAPHGGTRSSAKERAPNKKLARRSSYVRNYYRTFSFLPVYHTGTGPADEISSPSGAGAYHTTRIIHISHTSTKRPNLQTAQQKAGTRGSNDKSGTGSTQRHRYVWPCGLPGIDLRAESTKTHIHIIEYHSWYSSTHHQIIPGIRCTSTHCSSFEFRANISPLAISKTQHLSLIHI